MTRLGLGIPSAAVFRGRHAHPAGSPPPAEAAALFARMSLAPSAPRAAEISTLVSALLADGLWQKLDAFYVLAAHDAQAARLNWIADRYNLTAVNAPTFLVDRGYAGNGSTSWLDTGFNASSAVGAKYTLNSASLNIWCLTNVLGVGRPMGAPASSASAGYGYINPRDSDLSGRFSYALNNRADRQVDNTVGSSIGMWTAVRTTSGGVRSSINGSSHQVAANASATLPDNNFLICSGGPGRADTRQVAHACIGGNISTTEVAALYGAMRTYLVAVGAVAP